MPVTRRLALAPIAGGGSTHQMTAAEIHRLAVPSLRLRLARKYQPPDARPNSRLPASRRRAVTKWEREGGGGHSRADRTGGLFAVVSAEQGDGRILSMGEMLNAECHAYKEESIRKLAATLDIGTYYHDCACRVAAHFEGKYCNRCLLDSFHARGASARGYYTTRRTLRTPPMSEKEIIHRQLNSFGPRWGKSSVRSSVAHASDASSGTTSFGRTRKPVIGWRRSRRRARGIHASRGGIVRKEDI